MTGLKLSEIYYKYSEIYYKYYVGIYFIGLCIIAIFLNGLFIEAKENGLMKTSNLPDGIKEIWYFLITFIFGGFYGANIITLLDKKKKVQGILILMASLIILYLYSYIMTNRPVIFVLGLLLTAIIGIEFKTIKIEEKGGERIEHIRYDKAALIASCPAILFVGLIYLNYFFGIQINNFNIYNVLGYLILIVAFGSVFYKFMMYEISSINIFVVGPSGSGKTVFLCGCYMQALNNEKLTGLPSDDFFTDITMLNAGKFPVHTKNPRYDNFTYESGFFNKDVVLSAFDYDGEILENEIGEILEYIERKKKNPRLKPDENEVAQKIADSIYSANKLIFIIDAVREDIKYVINYKQILSAIKKQYYLVITKADLIFDTIEWWSKDYEELRKEVIKRNRNASVRTIEPTNKQLIIPTFFRVKAGNPLIDQKYLFSWGEIPGNDSKRLTDFLKQKFSIDWVKTANIEKIDNDKTIKVYTEKNFLLLKVNNEKDKLKLEIDDGRTDELIAKTENNKLNIYDQKFTTLGFDKILEIMGK